MGRSFTEQELADYLFDRLIVHGRTCPDLEWLRPACLEVAEELMADAEVTFKAEPVSDGGG